MMKFHNKPLAHIIVRAVLKRNILLFGSQRLALSIPSLSIFPFLSCPNSDRNRANLIHAT
jgi:hypothetical protein